MFALLINFFALEREIKKISKYFMTSFINDLLPFQKLTFFHSQEPQGKSQSEVNKD
jgi:hypothetical protein